MSLALANKIELLKDRAAMFARVRTFFNERFVLEVDTPLLSKAGCIDPHIDLISADCCGRRCYLHSSPEYAMKRLLAMGIGDCYQLGHVFRNSESGERHNPEFTMVEWYRHQFTLDQLIDETIALITLFLGEQPITKQSYEQVFYNHIGYFPTSVDERDRLFADEIEAKLEGLTVLMDYPPEQACLARKVAKEGEMIALRFEIFFNGVELCNGYDELSDVHELCQRLQSANEQRLQLGKERYPLDHQFLNAKIPPCCGVAIGFDRLMMLKHRVEHIQDIIPFHFEQL